ncbi:MAG TPA: PRC-barrel domain-containing protein [Deltaproteobacteria bacterium]|nr:PRC-barrel domain-containing protein [Deltaproteobacteria bacterium]HPR55836.1 PRC-barrel domain-containing protein [Deltaproteobacteria bacterium]HXK47695.1 PRC-barrel domain-containing protein [Deltaproteobacteria bacterium]
MLRSVQSLIGYVILATDGEIGNVTDLYFDDGTWEIRYAVVETGTLVSRHQVLLSPVVFTKTQWKEMKIPTLLNREQVENSPDIETDRPVSRQNEIRLHSYYGWPYYWSVASPDYVPPPTPISMTRTEETEPDPEKANEHLRSYGELLNYTLHATDGDLGYVEDFIIDDAEWIVQYLVVNTRSWLPGRKVLIAPRWVREISWSESSVHVDMDKESVKHSPEYDPREAVNREYEMRLYDYYGRPKYWE